jgi:KDO2-lipid IV(A) lauroyltransferase
MQLPTMSVQTMRPLLKVDGLEHLEEARAIGKGVLVVSCHMGSYEVVSAIWSATLTPVSFFAEELEPRALFEWYRDTRARLGISVLTLDHGGIRKVLQALRDKEMVITAIDRDITGTGHPMPFFGRPAPIPLGPAAIALRLGTPLFPVCVYRLPDDTYKAEGSPLVFATDTGDPKADQVAATQQVLSRIEGFIRRHPDQWHVPHRIWEGSP